MSRCDQKDFKGKRYRCFFELTLMIVGGKWKPIVLYQLSKYGMMRFGVLRRSIPDITERMLTRQLRELEADGLVYREIYREIPPKVEYSLTELGVSIIPLLQQMWRWGLFYESQQIDRDGVQYCAEAGYESKELPPVAEVYQFLLNQIRSI